MEGFIDTITVGETRKVSDARITSIHFPVLCYFALFSSRCLIGRRNCGNLNIPDIIILHHGLYGVGGNDTYGITRIPTTVAGRGVVRRADQTDSTRFVYPGSGRGDA